MDCCTLLPIANLIRSISESNYEILCALGNLPDNESSLYTIKQMLAHNKDIQRVLKTKFKK